MTATSQLFHFRGGIHNDEYKIQCYPFLRTTFYPKNGQSMLSNMKPDCYPPPTIIPHFLFRLRLPLKFLKLPLNIFKVFNVLFSHWINGFSHWINGQLPGWRLNRPRMGFYTLLMGLTKIHWWPTVSHREPWMPAKFIVTLFDNQKEKSSLQVT